MASRRFLSTLLLLGKLQLLVLAGTVPVRYLCPDEVLTLTCDHEVLGNGNKIHEAEWKVNDSRKNWQWTRITYCNGSGRCQVTEPKPTDGIKVLGISNGTLTIQRVSRNATIRHVDFLCVVETQKKAYEHKVKINLEVECIWTQIGADVNLTRHLADMVPRSHVQDVELYDVMDEKRKFAFCSGTMNCILQKVQRPPKFWNRLKQKGSSILLTRIRKDDEGLEIKVEIHFERGHSRRRSTGAPRVFKLKIRLEASQSQDSKSSSFNQSSRIELLQAYDAAPTVQTESGKAVGKIETLPLGKSVYTYLGIPFAEPPVGELRFAAPKPAKAWSGTRNATEYGASCPQPDYPLPGVKIPGEENEDCLFLNVFVPSTIKPNDKMAVMVWIHGGAFTLGSSTEYPGHVLASFNDVIVVTLNYRLGILGFFNGNDLKGNYGMFDQILALKWIQANIASFGGDPNRVTVFGESAGAFSVSLHLISPFSKGLFNRAILQSGAASSPLLKGKVASPNTLKEIKKIANCESEEELTRCLRSKSAEEIISVQEQFSSSSPVDFSEITKPVIDGKFLPGHPHNRYKHARFADQNVEVVIGFNSHEGALRVALKEENRTQVSKAEFDAEVKSTLGRGVKTERLRIVEEMVKFHYTDHDDPNNKTTVRKMMIDFQGDFMSVAPAIFEANALAKAGKRSYLYVFEHRPDFSPFSTWTGAFHGVEVGFVFGAPFKRMCPLADFFIPRFSEIEKGLSMYIMKLWTDFAKFGSSSPTLSGSNPSSMTWRPFTEEEQFYLALDVKPRLKKRYRAREVTFWNELIPKVTRKGRKGKTTRKP